MVIKITGLNEIACGGSADEEEKGPRVKPWGMPTFRSPEVEMTTERPGRSNQEGREKSKNMSYGGRGKIISGKVEVVNSVECCCKGDS